MPRISEQEKQRGMERVWLTIKRFGSRGVTEAEISEQVGIHRRTVHNYLTELFDEGKIIKEGKLWFHSHYEETRLLSVEVFPEEAYTFYLGSRLLVKQQDKRNELAESGLLKLADKLVTNARIGQEIAQAAHELARRPLKDGYESVFQTMISCYLRRQRVEILYKPLNGKEFSTIFETHLIEPSAIGYSTYVIGYRTDPRMLRAYKLERIQTAQPIDKSHYKRDETFPGLEILRNSWSIMLGDELLKIVLRFSPSVRERVLETQWHPSQAHCEDAEKPGWLRWWVEVTDTLDMEPWIRGWGADVEVLSPHRLRSKIEQGIRKLVKQYNIAELPPVPVYQLLWAKTSKDKQRTHPLICHLIDVGQAALALWNFAYTDSLRHHIARLLGLENDLASAGQTIAFWIALHDLGKASPAFQRMYKPAIQILEEAKLVFPPPIAKQKVWHATITAVTLDTLLPPSLNPLTRKQIARALGGHHGAWPSAQTLQDYRNAESMTGNSSWQDLRAELVKILQILFQPSESCQFSQDQAEVNSLLTLFSGMTTVADWVGSMEEYFDYVDTLPIDVAQYNEQAARKAQLALKELHWTGWQPPQQAASFVELFPYLTNGPSLMQQEVIQLAQKLTQPSLVIIEAPTGSGKTEAALYLADFWAHKLQQRGLYVAMPTMATSNQMFDRVAEFLERRYPSQSVKPLLIHSQARWMQEEPPPEIDTEEEVDSPEASESEGEAQDMTWFLPRKRSLLAPCGVGTVDQTLLGVLQTRHFFVRLLGLSHKTVIFDEVHAYDVYMSELFQKLLQWLRAMNVSVVLLSATLPAQKRMELLTAYAGPNCTPPSAVAYPAITWAMDGVCDVLPLPKPKDKPVLLEWVDRSPEAIVEKLRDRLSDGGCAAVICNTVARAQKMYDAILQEGVVDSEHLILFHARTRFGWRQKTEKDVLKLFGPGQDKAVRNPQRPNKAIVVATQVIEQSLDLDFDLLISDLAPIDLLIQRAGRLHRHPQNQAERRAKLTDPTLIVAASDTGEDLPDMEDDGHIYEPELLIRTYLSIHQRDKLTLPSETPDLIKQVYSTLDLSQLETPAITAALAKAQQTKADHETVAKNAATGKLILDVADERLLVQTNHQLDEEDPKVHQEFQAMTRLGPRTLSVVCLHEDDAGKLYTEPGNGGALVKLSQKPDAALTQALALSTLSISHQGLVQHLLKQADAKPTGWAKHALLRHHYIVRFQNGTTILPGTDYRLTLHEKTGLTIEKLPKPT